MDLVNSVLIILGLTLFEVINSVDNAIINAEVLSTMQEKSKRFFLFWGLLFAVVIVRGLLPWLIIWATNPTIGPVGAIVATFSQDPKVTKTIEESAPLLLVGAGIFLVFLFFHWLFLESKNFGLLGERFFQAQGVWFYAIILIIPVNI